jgi:hypothetical protein
MVQKQAFSMPGAGLNACADPASCLGSAGGCQNPSQLFLTVLLKKE